MEPLMPVSSFRYGHLWFGMGDDKEKKERVIENQMDDGENGV